MSNRDQARKYLLGTLGVWLPFTGGIFVVALAAWLHGLPSSPDPVLFEKLQFASGIVAITFAGAALIRFRGTQERLSLILAAGFAIVGVTLASSSLTLPTISPSESTQDLRDPVTWVIGRTLLAILLVSALMVQRRHAFSRHQGRDIAVALVMIVVISIIFSTLHRHVPLNFVVQPGNFFPRPVNLVPAAFFLLAAHFYHRRLKDLSSPFDLSLYLGATINFWCSVAAAQSDHRLDDTFGLAAILQFCGYAAFLGGALLDNIYLFAEVQRLAVTDPVTGLANYRKLMDSLTVEIQRTNRSGRPFALLLFDLDGLKKLNDQFGHQVGTCALCRVADTLRANSRSIDTAARHGGDEFALVLPETTDQGALEVLNRVCERLSCDGNQPTISLSAGCAIYPQDGTAVETLMDAADRALYRMKAQHKRIPIFVKQVAD